MSRKARSESSADPPEQQAAPRHTAATLPRGRIPVIGMRELVAALHRRRERRQAAAGELSQALRQLAASVEQHLARVAEVRKAIEAQGGDLGHLKHYDNLMARLRAELRSAERSLADAFSDASARG